MNLFMIYLEIYYYFHCLIHIYENKFKISKNNIALYKSSVYTTIKQKWNEI